MSFVGGRLEQGCGEEVSFGFGRVLGEIVVDVAAEVVEDGEVRGSEGRVEAVQSGSRAI